MRNKGKSRVFAREQHVPRHVVEDFIQATEGGGQRSDGISHDDKIALGSVVQEQDDLFRRVSGSEKGHDRVSHTLASKTIDHNTRRNV